MTLSEEARDRLADVVELQPTKNSELQERWGMDSGSEVHGYLESTLSEYYFRDDNSLIRATPEAADLVDVEPGVEGGPDDEGGIPTKLNVPRLQAVVLDVVAGPDERSESVVSVLNKVREASDLEPDAEDVRSALQRLRRTGVVEVEYRTVPTFRLAVERDALDVTITD
ncbi:DUF5797 family protein [Halovivax sp.]|uniref:DUF5797 family protein n=1 Tax=Halovivax sp. TaxID=1935978 RepID=UPI0025C3B489|nr:DUF5797 family protein [Halovivax sp.]